MAVESDIIFREPSHEDGAALYRLIKNCPPLDVNSPYLYFIVADHFCASSVVVECEGELLGCITGYRRPDQPDTLFIWQVAVHECMRGRGVSGQMLKHITSRGNLSDIKWIETTISPSNIASRKVFERFADEKNLRIETFLYLETEDFPSVGSDDSHEAEELFRIGPLS
ncbi:diaminobutyrate acetyltransferase [Kiritimatiellaeota bacterium B1221]|nr:diaminobutyrate acetyltransferase [Kiritimatiellaeota bacterium B1221]